MRTIVTMATLFVWLACAGFANSEEAKTPTLYTAYNIWKASKMKCINFKQGTDIIPVGTQVTDIRLKKPYRFPPLLFFNTVKEGRKYTVSFTERWHPKKSIEDYRDMMFTTKNFNELTEGLSALEIEAIRKGVLFNGMSKRAVLICYGPPPEHYTSNQNANTWYYWANRKDKIEIKFDHNGKLVSGGRSIQMEDKSEHQSKTVASKSQPISATETQVAAIPKFKLNKNEPWTGKWKVRSHRGVTGTWALKQHRNKIISTKDSLVEIEGSAIGPQLEGKFKALGQENYFYSFKVKISSDGLSFKGTITGKIGSDRGQITGRRVAIVGIPNGEAQEGQILYTAYNIWKMSRMLCINFKQGYDIIPVGTVVKDVHIWQTGNKSYIRFKTVKDGREYNIGFFEKWHPKKKIKDYRDKMFTMKNFEDLTKGLTEMEIRAIQKGILVNGMSKKAVLISYGHPPEHHTPNQNANTWYYWMNRRDKITLLFNQNRLVRGGKESTPGINKDNDIEAKLKKLRDLRDKELISQEEYEKKKAELLEEL